MNRVILIGNGFDLANGLKTSYNDFIDNFWNNKTDILKKIIRNRTIGVIQDNLLVKTPSGYKYNDNDIYADIVDFGYYFPVDAITQGSSGFDEYYFVISQFRIKENDNNLHFNNLFLERITAEKQLKYWVDIEEEYYSALVECQKTNGDIKKLNDDFSSIRIALQTYLSEQNTTEITIKTTYQNYFYSNFSNEDFIQLLSTDEVSNVLFLNFNYTSTVARYTIPAYNTKLINIHGELQNAKNPIIFGYGDEIDDNYKLIENMKNNDYLKYIKAFNYSRNNNYRDMLTFINADEYQIYIMGLSCGTSDRTLLNTLFEHKNCKSIKIFYHKKDKENDNYLDIYMNISRNFTNKQKMRELIVSKENSLPLPQGI
jgi:hypothetical protein